MVIESMKSGAEAVGLQRKPTDQRGPSKSRIVQTGMTDDELAHRGIIVLPAQSIPITEILVGGHSQWINNELPRLLPVPKYSDILIDYSELSSSSDPDLDVHLGRRIAEIRAIAAEESLALVEPSLGFAQDFLRTTPGIRLPGLFLVGNGNIRLVWDHAGERVGMQFLETGKVQFVILQKIDDHISEMMGTCPPSHILRIIDRIGLRAVITA